MHLQRTMLRQSTEDQAARQNHALRATGPQPVAYIRAGLNSATLVDLPQHSMSAMRPQ